MRDIVLAATLMDSKDYIKSHTLNDPYVITPQTHQALLWSMPLGHLHLTDHAPTHPRFIPWMKTILHIQRKRLSALEV